MSRSNFDKQFYVGVDRNLEMQISRCPKCRREPSVIRLAPVTMNIIDVDAKDFKYEVECYDCGLHTGGCRTLDEAVAKWSQITHEEGVAK